MSTSKAHEVLSNLTNEEWEKIIYKLTLHTCWLMKVAVKNKASDILSGGIQVKDIVQDAVTKVLTGERDWDTEVHPDLLKFLKNSVVRSLVSNYFVSPKTKNETTAGTLDPDPSDDGEADPFWETVKGNSTAADEELFAKEILLKLRDNLNDDDEAAIVFEEVIKGNKPKEIAKDLGISVENVNNALKRIRNTKAKQFKPITK